MSTSLIYHGFGVYGYKYFKTEYREGKIFIHIKKKPEYQYCADCESRNVARKGYVERELKTLPIGKKSVYMVLHLHRLYCRDCGALKLEPLLITFPKKHWTKALFRYIVDLLHCMTIEDVSKHLDMSWDTVKDIHVEALKKKYKKRKLKRANAKIEAITMDMWPAYIKATLNYYSYDIIVFDRYHIISDCNKMIDELRRKEAQTAEKTEKNVYTGVRYLLLKGQEKIENDYKAKYRLNRLLEINQSLNTVYILKEELRAFWDCTTHKEAEQYLSDWLKKAWVSGIGLVKKFANMIAAHRVGILNYFNHPITTGLVEGINNKIKVLKR